MIHVIPTDTCFGFACNIYDKKGYNKIYEIKGRNFKKPLPILVKTFDDLADILDLNFKQIEFLKIYRYPFTILAKPSKNFIYPPFLDKSNYSCLAVRVGEIILTADILNLFTYPLFLTSANKSGDTEFFSSSEIKKEFIDFIKDMNIIEAKIKTKRASSNIFEFIEDSTKLNFIRKNY